MIKERSEEKIALRVSVAFLLLGAVAVASLCFLSGCSMQRGHHEPGVLRMNVGTEPPGLDWETNTDSTSFDVVSNIMEGLTEYTPDLKCAPGCARSWEVLDGGKRYVFHLRDDIYWTDGKKLTASDFVYAWRRLLNPQTAASYAYFLYDVVGAFEFNTGKVEDEKQLGLRAPDDLTFEVTLTKPAAYFIYLTAFCPTLPVRKDVIERFGDRWTEPAHIVTNGPFMLTHWQHEYKIELAANPHYFKGVPRLKKIKMFMVPEQSTAFALYENDELDYVDNRSFSTSDVEMYKSSPEYLNIPLLRNNYVGFNTTIKPFDDVRVRRAVAMAIDRSAFPRILRRNERPCNTWVPPGLNGYSPTSGLGFDVGAARKLLAQAGYPNGKGFPHVDILYPNREDAKLVVEELQDQLRRNLNIELGIENTEWKVYLRKVSRDPPPIFRATWGADYPDPQTFMNLYTSHSGNNYTRWHSDDYDRLIERAGAEQNPSERGRLYQEADRLLCRQACPIVPTYLATQNLMIKPWVKGMRFNALDLTFLEQVSVE